MASADETDVAIISFYDQGLEKYGDRIDTLETFPGGFNLYTLSEDGELLSSSGLPRFDCDENVKLMFFNANEGHYNLAFLFGRQISGGNTN